MLNSQGLCNNPYPDRIHQTSHIHTYFFKIHLNIVLPPTPSPPKGLFTVGVQN